MHPSVFLLTHARRALNFGLIALFSSLPLAAQTTYKPIPLDCGGYFSGFATHSSGRLYGYGDVFGLWRSDNAGQTWTSLQTDFTLNDYFAHGVAVAASDANIVAYVTSGRVYRSTNGGSSWTTLLSDRTAPFERGASPLMIHPANSNELWLAGSRNALTGTLWRSTDAGASWSKIGGTTFDSDRAVTIYVHPGYPDQIWVGASGGLYVSADHGSNWTRIWNNGGVNNAYDGSAPKVRAIVRRTDGIAYFASNVGGCRVTATNWASPATYTTTMTLTWWSGWGPCNATVLADGSFLSGDVYQFTRRSTDAGVTWTDLGNHLATPPTPIWAVPTGPTDKLYYGLDMIVQDPTTPSRLFVTGGFSPAISNDTGANWQFPPNAGGLAGTMTYRVRFPRANPARALIPASDLGVCGVNDGGYSGQTDYALFKTLPTLFTVHDMFASPDGSTIIAPGVNQETNTSMITRSTDGGVTWSALNLSGSGLPTSYEGITRATMAPGNVNDYLVLLGYNSSNPNNNPGLYRTTNGGTSFAKVGGTLFDGVDTGMRYHPENSFLESDGVNTNTRYLWLRSPNLSGAKGFYRSTDGGSSWSMVTSPFGTDWVQSLAVDPTLGGRVWVAGGYRGLARTSDGGTTWSTVGSFTGADRVDAYAGRIAVWGQRSGDTWNKVYYSADNGVTWSEKTGSGQRYAHLRDLAVDPWRPGQIWVSGISVNVINPPAQPIGATVSDSFAYPLNSTPPTLLDNKAGGTGWSGTWSAGNANVESTGLTYSSGGVPLKTSGTSASINYWRTCFRSLATAASTGDVWVSFLAKVTTPGAGYGGVSLFSGSTEVIFLGQRYGQTTWGAERAGSGIAQNTTISSGNVSLIVAKLTLSSGGTSQLRMWVNPALGQIPTDASAQVTLTGLPNFSFDTVRIAASDYTQLDEIRFGQTFYAVTPVGL